MKSDLAKVEPSDPFREVGAIIDQRYRLGEGLGEGPIHSAHKAFDILENREVCLKIPKPRFRVNEGFTMRYRRDLIDVMMLSDPNWLTPLCLAEHDGVPIQVLPLVEGEPFAEWFEQSQRHEGRLIQVLTRTLKALHRLQKARGQMHGSVKPSNLYVCSDDEPLFTDLAATGRLEDHFVEKATSGEPIYCSPEQLCGERGDASTDLYSLGLVLYEALARRHPFFGLSLSGESSGPERLLTSLLSQLQTKPTPPSNYADDVPRWADRFLARCLHPHPDERFSTAAEAVNWLKNHTKHDHDMSAEQRTLAPAGREHEMNYLEERLDQIRMGQDGGMIVRLRGDLGCGKTRCLSWLLEKAKSHEMRVVVVEPIPESGLHLQSVISALSVDSPDLAEDAQPVVESLLGIALEEPMLMIIRDIQQADGTLVEFLRELSSVLNDVQLLLILVDEETTYRSTEMRAFVAALKQTLHLAPLDRRGIANLIEEKSWTAPTPSVSAWVHAVSGGNALHAILLVEYLQNNNLVSDALDLAWTSSPPTERPNLEEVIEWKLSGLSELGRSLLEIAAVLGHPFRLSTLNAITYRNEDEVDGALGEGVSKGLLELARRRGAISYRWKHPTFRTALLKKLHRRRKKRIHRLAAAFYSRGVPDPSKMAFHFLQAGDKPELFYWGSLAIERAREQNRRGDCIYWMNVLLSRIPEQTWLGPNVQKARREVARDQADSLDLTLWPKWLRTLSGRTVEATDGDDPLWAAQNALSSSLAWPDWRQRVGPLIPELRSMPSETSAKALALLEHEWRLRAEDGELFPGLSD
jgi:Protein kinase domain